MRRPCVSSADRNAGGEHRDETNLRGDQRDSLVVVAEEQGDAAGDEATEQRQGAETSEEIGEGQRFLRWPGPERPYRPGRRGVRVWLARPIPSTRLRILVLPPAIRRLFLLAPLSGFRFGALPLCPDPIGLSSSDRVRIGVGGRRLSAFGPKIVVIHEDPSLDPAVHPSGQVAASSCARASARFRY